MNTNFLILNVDNNERPNNLSLPIPQNYAFTNDFIHDNTSGSILHNAEKNLVTGNIDFTGNNDVIFNLVNLVNLVYLMIMLMRHNLLFLKNNLTPFSGDQLVTGKCPYIYMISILHLYTQIM